MATLIEVERALDLANPTDGVIVCDDRLRLLAFRPPVDGGGAYILVLGDPDLCECAVRPRAYGRTP